MRRWLICGCVLAVACSKGEGAGSGGGGRGRPRTDKKLEYPVQVLPIARRKVQYSVSAPGTVEAFQKVQITARVAGVLDKVSFKEGEVVKAGQTLASIEPDRYRVAVGQAKAALSKAKANQHDAEAQLGRREGATAAHPGLIPAEEIATHATGVETAKADVEVANQALRAANLNLRDSSVRAPIAGVVQTRQVQTGQYLQAGAVIATILQREPLLLRFQVTPQEAPRLKTDMNAMFILSESPRVFTSKITLVAGEADVETRLVPVTAQVEETDHQYWLRPGAFCKVIVPIGTAREAIVVPTIAVQPTENGTIVYVVEKDAAHVRKVTLGMYTPEGGVEVKTGLNPGDQLVVRGLEPLSEGAPVKITEKTTSEALEAVDGGSPEPVSSAPPPEAPPAGSAERSRGERP